MNTQNEYIEILCPVCGRAMGRKATVRIPAYRGKTKKGQVIKSEDYLDFMIRNYDENKEIAILKEATGRNSFKNYRRLAWQELDKDKKTKFKQLLKLALKSLLKRKIITKKFLSSL